MKLNISLLILLLIVPVKGFSGSKTKDSISVLTYNVWMVPFQRKMAKARAEAVGKTLGKYDMIFLQEAFTAGIRKTIATYARKKRSIVNRYQTRVIHRLNSGKFTLGKYEVVKTSFRRYRNCGGIQCVSGKGILYVQVRLPSGQLLDTFNTHLQAYEKDAHIRKWQLVEAMSFIDNINNGDLPILFVGDFNIIAKSNEYPLLKSFLIGYKDVWTQSNPLKPGFTWNPETNPWAKFDYDESTQLQRLDYIFVRDGKLSSWQIKSSKLRYNTEKKWFGVFKNPNFIFGSDHFGVSAKLQLNKL
jgi:endonuclease/exonuclease/phosphatase family metal-dependent hydrolase